MNRSWKLVLLAPIAGAILALTGCQQASPRHAAIAASVERSLTDDANQGPGAQAAKAPVTAPPAAISQALLPRLTPMTSKAPVSQRFEISVKDAPAQAFFMSLVEGTPYNMVVHPEVAGTISLRLKNASIPEVLEIARDVYGYEYRQRANGFEVLPRRLQARIYQVDFLNIRRSGASQTRVSSGQVTQVDRGVSRVSEDGQIRGNTARGRVTGTEINTLQPDTTFWVELSQSLNTLVGSEGGRSVVVNPQSGVVVVRAMPNEHREVAAFLAATQANTSRQVVLEAKVVEVELNDGYRQGINWSGLIDVNGNPITFGQVGGGTIFDNGVSATAGNTGNLDPNALTPIVGTAAAAFGGMFSVALAFNNFTAFIELLETQGTVHVLSSPRIATLNNQKAVIKVGSDEFFVTDVSSTTTTGDTPITTPSIELTPFFSGIALDVTPQISRDGNVLLHVHPSISEVEDQSKKIDVVTPNGRVEQTLPLAFSTVRESDSIVSARSGQIIVIGGLMKEVARSNRADSPLAAIPGVGDVLGHSQNESFKSELVILLKPIVIDSPDRWTEMRADAGRRVSDIGNLAELPGRYGQQRQ